YNRRQSRASQAIGDDRGALPRAPSYHFSLPSGWHFATMAWAMQRTSGARGRGGRDDGGADVTALRSQGYGGGHRVILCQRVDGWATRGATYREQHLGYARIGGARAGSRNYLY